MPLHDPGPSRPASPLVLESPSTASLRMHDATLSDLTAALSNSSKIPSPETDENVGICCCGKGLEECEAARRWTESRRVLEGRLVLCAEIGQALLEKHEAYVRKHQAVESVYSPLSAIPPEGEAEKKIMELVRENTVLEKRLTQSLLNASATELAHQYTLAELASLREQDRQLSAQNARLVGVETRLQRAEGDREDMVQERDMAVRRAGTAESRVSALESKCGKLQTKVEKLRDEVEMYRGRGREPNEDILSEAREKLEQLLQMHIGQTALKDDGEIMKVLESIVADNELLKQDNAELQGLLAEAREDLRAAQEEVEEHRADTPYSLRRGYDPHQLGSPLDNVFRVGTAPTVSPIRSMFPRRASSVERSFKRTFEPLTPETTRRPLSPPDSVLTRGTRFTASRPYAPSHLLLEGQSRSRGVQTDSSLTYNSSYPSTIAPSPIPRGLGQSTPSYLTDDHSESSSLLTGVDANPSVLSSILDRASQLLTRLIHADALTLTNRLKRQHLVGGDVNHLSRSTVSSIISESATLRTQFRAYLEDEKVITSCTRRDLRALFRLLKDVFGEMGSLRVAMNEVILDPTCARRISEAAMHPTKDDDDATETGAGAGMAGWIAPLSKLLGIPTSTEESASRSLSPPATSRPAAISVQSSSSSTSTRSRPRPPPRIVPKREPALSASAMTVNVEFSGRAVTSIYSAHPDRTAFGELISPPNTLSPTSISGSIMGGEESRRKVMDIFAGAPKPPLTDPSDPWIVIPKPQRPPTVAAIRSGVLKGRRYELAGSATLGRSTFRSATGPYSPGGMSRVTSGGMSRIVDSLTDPDPPNTPVSPEKLRKTESGRSRLSREEDDEDSDETDQMPDTLLERTLRPRGLSDSSLRSTFLSQAVTEEPEQTYNQAHDDKPLEGGGTGVFRALSKRMQSFRLSSTPFSGTRPIAAPMPSALSTSIVINPDSCAPSPISTKDASMVSRPSTPVKRRTEAMDIPVERATSPGTFFPALTSWAAAAATLPADASIMDAVSGMGGEENLTSPYYVSTRETSGRGA